MFKASLSRCHHRLCPCFLYACIFAAIISGAEIARADNIVANPSFETQASTLGSWPTGYGYWQGDESEIVTAENGITPRWKDRMLHFISTASAGASTYQASEVVQLLDVSGYSGLIASGNAEATGYAYFNRVAGDSQTDTEFRLRLDAMSGALDGFRNDRAANLLDTKSTTSVTDADLSTWAYATIEFSLPSNTDYLAVTVMATENVFNDETGTEFDGHYADSVSIQIVPEPTAVTLLALGSLAFLRRKRRR